MIGLAGAAVVSARAAAWRTSTAYERLRGSTKVDDLRMVSSGAVPPARVSALPEVVASRGARMGVGQAAGPDVAYIAVQSLAAGPADLSQPRPGAGPGVPDRRAGRGVIPNEPPRGPASVPARWSGSRC
ncbi:MAG: hypothetical protein ACRD0N_06940 [Acidimicrobiales bacterium]